MTEAQIRAINKLICEIVEDAYDGNAYEFKEYEVSEVGSRGTVALHAVVGLKKDEGTLAAIFCRNSYHIFIGRRGGLSFVNDRGKVKPIKRAFQAMKH